MITVYSIEGCSSCVAATKLLTAKGIEHIVTKADEDFAAWEFLKAQGLRSFPQIYRDGELIPGGYVGLQKHLS